MWAGERPCAALPAPRTLLAQDGPRDQTMILSLKTDLVPPPLDVLFKCGFFDPGRASMKVPFRRGLGITIGHSFGQVSQFGQCDSTGAVLGNDPRLFSIFCSSALNQDEFFSLVEKWIWQMRRCLTINGGFFNQHITGVQRYGREIVAELDRLLQDDRLKSSLSAKVIVPAGSELSPALGAIAFHRTASGGGPLWHQFVLPFATQGVLLSLCKWAPCSPRTISSAFTISTSFSLRKATLRRTELITASWGIVSPDMPLGSSQIVLALFAHMLNDFGFRHRAGKGYT